MGKTKKYLEVPKLRGNMIPHPELMKEWPDGMLEPLMSNCCNAPVNYTHGRFICTECHNFINIEKDD